MSDYQSEIKKPILDRQYSDASSYKSTPRSSRKASVASTNSQASARSDISKYSSASLVDSAGQLIPPQHQKDSGPKPVLRRTYTDLDRDPGLEPLIVKSNRLYNVQLRHITSEERAIYAEYTINGISSHYQDGNLTTMHARSMRLPASEFMIAFKVKTGKGFIDRALRLSHCDIVSGHSTPVINVLSRMQAGLKDSEPGHTIRFPAGCLFTRADFPHGMREKHATAGTLQVNLNFVDPRRKTIKSVACQYISTPAVQGEGAARIQAIALNWTVQVYILRQDSPINGYLEIPFSKLDHASAFPDRLKAEGTQQDIAKWLRRSEAGVFTVTDIKLNMLGGIVRAKLNRVTEPFVPVLEADVPPAGASVRKSRGWRK